MTAKNNAETQQIDSKDGWGEPLESDFFRFETAGDVLIGKLIEKTDGIIRGQPSKKYKIETENGVTVGFNGVTKINDVLDLLPLGTMVRIEYTGLSDNKTRSGNRMKEFDIRSK